MADDDIAVWAEIPPAIARDILTMPELSDPDWDTFAMVAEVMDFVSREAADKWRVTPWNADHLAEALRPQPADFEPH